MSRVSLLNGAFHMMHLNQKKKKKSGNRILIQYIICIAYIPRVVQLSIRLVVHIKDTQPSMQISALQKI